MALHNEASFAALCAANKALYIIALFRMRYCPRTKPYVERRQAQGLSNKEAIRALKRYIARDFYHVIRADLTQPPSPSRPHPLDDL